MPSWIYKRGRRYWLRYVDAAGDRKSKPLVPPGKTQATTIHKVAEQLQRVHDAMQETRAGEQLLDLDKLKGKWLLDNQLRGRREAWRITSDTYVQRFLDFSAAKHPEDLTRESVKVWSKALLMSELSPKTVANMVAALSAFCGWLEDEELIQGNPCRRVLRLQAPERFPRYLDDAGYQKTLALADEYGLLPEVATALWTGLRLSELRGLQWRDVQWEQRVVMVREEGEGGRRTKSGRSRSVPMRDSLLELLEGHAARTVGTRRPRTMEPVFRDRTRRWWETALEPIKKQVPAFRSRGDGSSGEWKGPGSSWHLLRHTFASRYVSAGGSIFKLSVWLGHSDISTTMIYAHLAPQHDSDIEKV